MKAKIYLVITLLVLGFTTANAQKQNAKLGPEEQAVKQTERMATDLKLDDKQKADVGAINAKYAKMRNEIFQANKGKKEVVQSKMKDMNAQKKAELKKVLTPEQFTQMEKLEKKKAEVHGQKMEQHKGMESKKPVK